jgi:hypothetical protein
MKRLAVGLVGVSALAFAGWQTPIENEVNQVETMVNARLLASALNLYAADNDGVYPYPYDLKGLKWVTEKYVEDKKTWRTLNPRKGEFRFNMSLGGVAKADIAEPGKTVLLYESNDWPNRQRAVAFADGSARLLKPVEWGFAAHSLFSQLPRKAERLPKDYGKRWKE